MSNILKQYRVAGEDKNVRVINSNSMIKQIFADSISHPADSYTGISSDAQSSLGITKTISCYAFSRLSMQYYIPAAGR